MISRENFEPIVGLVIDNFEGGYYHPDMLNDSRGAKWSQASRDVLSGKAPGMSPSGETMFGLDRLNGNQEKYPEGREFWSLIDKQNARKTWAYNYRGGSLSSKLKKLAGDIQHIEFVKNSKHFDKETLSIVEKDARLVFHFAYATWNGPGFFQRWADSLDAAIKRGIKDPDELVKIAMQDRKKSTAATIKKSADIMLKVFVSPLFAAVDFAKKK